MTADIANSWAALGPVTWPGVNNSRVQFHQCLKKGTGTAQKGTKDMIAINEGQLVAVGSRGQSMDTLSGGCKAEGQDPRAEDLEVRQATIVSS